MIRKAIKDKKTFDIDSLMEYCFELKINGWKEETEEDDQNRAFNIETIRSDLFAKLKDEYDPYDLDDEGKSQFEETLTKIWEKFRLYLNRDFEHCVSLSRLGRLLQSLKDQSNDIVRRQKPAFLETGVVNLIVCPRDEIVKRVLSIYALNPDQPLPGDDEVLYCNSDTTSEEIELFFRRVLGAGKERDDKIYVFANVQVRISFHFT